MDGVKEITQLELPEIRQARLDGTKLRRVSGGS